MPVNFLKELGIDCFAVVIKSLHPTLSQLCVLRRKAQTVRHNAKSHTINFLALAKAIINPE